MARVGKERKTTFVKHPIENYFPGLIGGAYQITSPESVDYNCIAWAAGQVDVWWEPDPFDLYYWPHGIPRRYDINVYVRAFGVLGYVRCETGEFEPGFEKVAIYVDPMGSPTHATRQMPNGKWTSKLGELEDIEHATLDCLSGAIYGTVALFLKRRIQVQMT